MPPQPRRGVRQGGAGKPQCRDCGAHADHLQRRPLELAQQYLGQYQRDTYAGEGDARGLGSLDRGQVQAVEGKEAHGDLRDRHAEHGAEGHQQRATQARIAQPHRARRMAMCQGCGLSLNSSTKKALAGNSDMT